jgi:hypothetical protein|tara:strand:- start:244 stop:564 length:321 start_codon:yes stop_codon:yes gene_type:complete
MSTTKIKLKEGYPQGYLPQGVSYTNYTMLVAIANYSKNLVCVSNAKAMLDTTISDVRTAEKKRLMDGMGSFMHAVCVSDFAMAWRRADGSNREALIQGLTNNEIEL